jgi:hypothetical protein
MGGPSHSIVRKTRGPVPQSMFTAPLWPISPRRRSRRGSYRSRTGTGRCRNNRAAFISKASRRPGPTKTTTTPGLYLNAIRVAAYNGSLRITHQRVKQHEKLHPVSRYCVWRSDRHVLYSRQRGCRRTKLGKQVVFGESITFTLSRPTALGLRRGWLGGTLARDDVCVGNPGLALRNIVAAG